MQMEPKFGIRAHQEVQIRFALQVTCSWPAFHMQQHLLPQELQVPMNIDSLQLTW